MKTRVRLIGLALLGMLIISTSCKKEEDKVEERLGTHFTVTTSDGGSWTADAPSGKIEGGSFVIKGSKDGKEVVLTIKEFVKAKYSFDNSSNHATYTPDKSDASKLYSSSISADNYVEIINIHTNGTTFDGTFSFLSMNANNDIITVSGSWINVPKY